MEPPISYSIDRKLDELISLVEETDLDNAEKRKIQQKLNTALKLAGNTLYDQNSDGLNQFFNEHTTDTRTVKKNNLINLISRISRIVTSLLMILLGFGMIIMPAPPYFEMFTLFYLNPNDGVTIMDVISLIVAFAGISLFISAVIKFNK